MNPALVGAGIAAGKGVINGDPMDKILKDAVVGGATGYLGGQMMPTDMFGASSALNSTAGNSLNAGASLMGGTGTAVGSNIGAGTTSLLGSPTNIAPAYDIGMGGNSANLNGFTGSAYTPITNNLNQPIAPNFSTLQANTGVKDNFGTPARPIVDEYPTIMGGEGSTIGLDTTTRDTMGNFIQNPTEPDFNNITKSTAEELEAAQGGFEKPLYERAFDSVVGFAEKNPIEMAGLGLTAFGALKEPPKQGPDSSFARSAGVVRNAYSPTRSPILQIKRA
tara:strand:- start:3633 stop:4466 length:834 start_codon:yes stop_codon:yes gene_type:complete